MQGSADGTMTTDLSTLLKNLTERFPPEHPIELRPSAGPDAWTRSESRFPDGHARRWFAATDGQANTLPAFLAHSFCSLDEARDALRIADDIRAEADRCWVEPEWLAIAGDGAGQHIMIDDRDGRVLRVAHDDDYIDVLAPSPEAWIASLLRDLDEGVLAWDETFGLIETEELARIRAHHEKVAARQQPGPLPLKHKIGLSMTLLGLTVLMALFIWFLETHR